MHIGLHHRAIDPYLATPLHSRLGSVADHHRPDGLQRQSPHLLQVLRQRRPGGRGLQGPETAEGAVGHRVRQMELELPVAEGVHLLEEKHTQNLIPAHPWRTSLWTLQAPHQVLPYELSDVRMEGEDLADLGQFSGVAVLDVRLLQRQLLVTAHSAASRAGSGLGFDTTNLRVQHEYGDH